MRKIYINTLSYTYVCIYICGAVVHLHAHVQGRSVHRISLLYHSLPYVCRQFLVEHWMCQMAGVVSNETQGSSVPASLVLRLQVPTVVLWCLHGCEGSELRSLCLHDRHFTHCPLFRYCITRVNVITDLAQLMQFYYVREISQAGYAMNWGL